MWNTFLKFTACSYLDGPSGVTCMVIIPHPLAGPLHAHLERDFRSHSYSCPQAIMGTSADETWRQQQATPSIKLQRSLQHERPCRHRNGMCSAAPTPSAEPVCPRHSVRTSVGCAGNWLRQFTTQFKAHFCERHASVKKRKF